MRRRDLLFAAPGLALLGRAGPLLAADYAAAEKAAKGQTVYFNAWGGAQEINDYIAWAGDELGKRFGVGLVHVKLTDTSEAVARVVAEKAAGRDSGGSGDLGWVNREKFPAMKQEGLPLRAVATDLPEFRY